MVLGGSHTFPMVLSDSHNFPMVLKGPYTVLNGSHGFTMVLSGSRTVPTLVHYGSQQFPWVPYGSLWIPYGSSYRWFPQVINGSHSCSHRFSMVLGRLSVGSLRFSEAPTGSLWFCSTTSGSQWFLAGCSQWFSADYQWFLAVFQKFSIIGF